MVPSHLPSHRVVALIERCFTVEDDSSVFGNYIIGLRLSANRDIVIDSAQIITQVDINTQPIAGCSPRTHSVVVQNEDTLDQHPS